MRTVTGLAATLAVLLSACTFDPGGGPGDDRATGIDPSGVAPTGADPGGPGFPCAGADPATDDGLGGETRCFPAETDPGDDPLVVVEYAFESYGGVDAVHVRLTFDPSFNDNSYGAHAIGWDERDKGHSFADLVGSDHADVVMVDSGGDVVFDLSLDYLSEDPSSECGWASLGIGGKDGEIRVGDAADVLGWSTSLDRNLNERGYCQFVVDSPLTDEWCTPSSEAPDWDFRVVYDVWVRRAAFAPAGFGTAHMNEVHASPSKADANTITVRPDDCPADWCTDPDGCDGGGGDCDDNSDCPTNELCGEGTCVPIVQ